MAQTQTQVQTLRPGEIVSFGDRIVWVTVTPSNPVDVDCIMYAPLEIPEWYIRRAKETGDSAYLTLGYWTVMGREAEMELKGKIKSYRIRKVAMGWASMLQYYDVYEMKVPLWRRILAILKPIRIYGYLWKGKEKIVKMAIIEFRGLKLKPRIVSETVL